MHSQYSIIEAYDDGFFPVGFKGGRGYTYIAGVETSGESSILDIAVSRVIVDGRGTQRVITEMSRLLGGEVILLDGVTYAGFDVVDPFMLHEETGKPVIAVQLYPIDIDRIKAALAKHFTDGMERFRIISQYYSRLAPVETAWRRIHVAPVGIGLEDAAMVIRNTCIYSPVPEPLRIADWIASSLSRALVRWYAENTA